MACEKLELTQRNLARVRKMLFGACAEIELDLIDEKAPLGFPLDFESMDPRVAKKMLASLYEVVSDGVEALQQAEGMLNDGLARVRHTSSSYWMEEDGSLTWSTKPKSGANCRERSL